MPVALRLGIRRGQIQSRGLHSGAETTSCPRSEYHPWSVQGAFRTSVRGVGSIGLTEWRELRWTVCFLQRANRIGHGVALRLVGAEPKTPLRRSVPRPKERPGWISRQVGWIAGRRPFSLSVPAAVRLLAIPLGHSLRRSQARRPLPAWCVEPADLANPSASLRFADRGRPGGNGPGPDWNSGRRPTSTPVRRPAGLVRADLGPEESAADSSHSLESGRSSGR